MPKVHFCSELRCQRVIQFDQRYCEQHAKLHQQERFDKLKQMDRSDYFKHYNQEVRPEESNRFYSSKQWKQVSEYVKQRDMMTSGVTGKVLSDHDCITDHCVRRDLCSNPLDTNNLWLLSKREHYFKTLIEQDTLKKPNGKQILKHASKKWWIKVINERLDKFGNQKGQMCMWDKLCWITFIAFLICKLIGWISWSWWLVATPLIVWISFYLLIFIIAIIVEVLIDGDGKQLNRLDSNDPEVYKKLYPDNKERQLHLNYMVRVRKLIHDNRKVTK